MSINLASPIPLQGLAVVVWIMHLPHCCNVSRSHSKATRLPLHLMGALIHAVSHALMLCYMFRFRAVRLYN